MSEDCCEKLKRAFAGDLKDYKSIPFWSWNNEIDETELVKQIEEMYSAGVGGFIMHARTGLKTEYLGEKWFSCIEACLKKARELNMNAWIYDENGWPSGFVGGKLLENEEFRARFLRYEIKPEYDSKAFVVYEKTADGYARITAKREGVAEYHTLYLMVSPANTDILNPEVVDAFINETHEKYYERFKESFGRELTGFFTDEPQYYRYETPYTKMVDAEFAKNGLDVKDGLIYLFLNDERGYEFKTKYFTTLNRLYTQNFYKKLYDWCEAHHCKLTGHSIEETTLNMQMWGGAGVMPSYEYEHIPAIDWLGREGNEISSRQIGSVASQIGIKQVLTETFAVCGYDVTPKELKHIGEIQYFNGVNLMCQHLYPYSIALQGKYDYPPSFSKHGNWFDGFKIFNDYFTRLGYLVANTEENAEIAVVHPMRGIYLDYIRKNDAIGVEEINEGFLDFIATLRKMGISYQLVDESILERHGKIENGALRVGNRTYHTVLVPHMRSISQKTYECLRSFKGKLFIQKDLEFIDGQRVKIDLRSNTTLDEIAKFAPYPFEQVNGSCFITYRRGELGDFVFLKNLSRTQPATLRVKGISKEYKRLDLETLKTENVADEFIFKPCDGIVLIKDGGANSEEIVQTTQDVTTAFRCVEMSENYLVMDYARLSYDKKTWTALRPISSLFEELLFKNHKGEVHIEQYFKIKDCMPLSLMVEKANYKEIAVNGQPITFKQSDFDINFQEADISSLSKEGENTFSYTLDWLEHDGVHFALYDPLATESVRNCLYYDCSLENAYIKGDFALDKNFVIKNSVVPLQLTNRLNKDGYPFFKGEILYQGNIFYDGKDKKVLSLKGDFLVANVKINGVNIPFALDKEKDVTEYLQKGENAVEIEVRIGLRNLFGPHHYAPIPNLTVAAPRMFTFRTEWDRTDFTKCLNYTHEYNCVPFGLYGVEVITKTKNI
ncbi:MAG: hypothetical protein IJX75_06175 [Clostridia bacterium]|nr:hypothetical protein [Clostridia bacterium]